MKIYFKYQHIVKKEIRWGYYDIRSNLFYAIVTKLDDGCVYTPLYGADYKKP